MEFHFIITITEPDERGLKTGTFSGNFMAGDGQTRNDAFREIFAYAKNQMSVTEATVTYFDLALNKLPIAC